MQPLYARKMLHREKQRVKAGFADLHRVGHWVRAEAVWQHARGGVEVSGRVPPKCLLLGHRWEHTDGRWCGGHGLQA